MPVGMCRMRTAVSTLFTFWPPVAGRWDGRSRARQFAAGRHGAGRGCGSPAKHLQAAESRASRSWATRSARTCPARPHGRDLQVRLGQLHAVHQVACRHERMRRCDGARSERSGVEICFGHFHQVACRQALRPQTAQAALRRRAAWRGASRRAGRRAQAVCVFCRTRQVPVDPQTHTNLGPSWPPPLRWHAKHLCALPQNAPKIGMTSTAAKLVWRAALELKGDRRTRRWVPFSPALGVRKGRNGRQ